MTKEDLTGQQFGKWTVIKQLSVDKNHRVWWKVVCECGTESKKRGDHLKSPTIGGCHHCRYNNHPLHHLWHHQILRGAKKRKYKVTISIEDAWRVLEAQNFKCVLTGLSIDHRYFVIGDEINYPTASLDRIDSSKGYIKGNVQWVHKVINQMKWNNSQENFIQYCKLVAKKN